MAFIIDYEITKELLEQHGENLKKQFMANFALNFFNQLKNKINYNDEKLTLDKNGKQIEFYRFSCDIPFIKNKTKEEKIKIKDAKEYKNLNNVSGEVE